MTGITRGLVIKKPHVDNILSGLKTWEMRSTQTSVRGRIAIIESGSGMVVGEATLERVQEAPTRFRSRDLTRYKHRLPQHQYSKMDKWKYAWVLSNAKRFPEPIPYQHPQGAVIWVDLTKPGVIQNN